MSKWVYLKTDRLIGIPNQELSYSSQTTRRQILRHALGVLASTQSCMGPKNLALSPLAIRLESTLVPVDFCLPGIQHYYWERQVSFCWLLKLRTCQFSKAEKASMWRGNRGAEKERPEVCLRVPEKGERHPRGVSMRQLSSLHYMTFLA